MKLDDVRDLLPDLDELRPVLDLALTRSEPDPDRAWSGSGQLDTAANRLLDEEALVAEAEQLASAEAEHLRALYHCVTDAIAHLAAGRRSEAGHALLRAAELEERRDRPRRAEAYAVAAYRAVRGENDQRPAALALRRQARAARTLGRLGEALARYEKAFEVASAMSDPRGAAEAAIGAGNVLEEQGRWPNAAHWYETALTSLDDFADPAPERWHALLNLHIVKRSEGAVQESIDWLARAEVAAKKHDPESSAPFLQNARGQLEMALGAYAAAERRLRSALDSATATRVSVTIRLNLAEALLAQDRSLEAAEEARRPERNAIRAGLSGKLPEIYRLLGRIADHDGNPDAFVLFERALQIVREEGLPALEEALTLQAYAAAERRRGDEAVAAQLHEAAEERFGSLGINRMRDAWADVFDQGDSGASLRE